MATLTWSGGLCPPDQSPLCADSKIGLAYIREYVGQSIEDFQILFYRLVLHLVELGATVGRQNTEGGETDELDR